MVYFRENFRENQVDGHDDVDDLGFFRNFQYPKPKGVKSSHKSSKLTSWISSIRNNIFNVQRFYIDILKVLAWMSMAAIVGLSPKLPSPYFSFAILKF